MRITEDLREHVDFLYEHGRIVGLDHGMLLDIADRIDAEHERCMDDRVKVVRCVDCARCQRHIDGSHVCELTHLAHRADYYCYFGSRREANA